MASKCFRYLFLCFLYLFGIISTLSAQDILRKEYDASNDEVVFHLIPISENGVVIIQTLYKKEKGLRHFKLIHLSTSMEEVFEERFTVPKGYRFVGIKKGDDKVVALFDKEGKERNFDFVVYQYRNKELNRFSVSPGLGFKSNHYCISGNYAYIGGKSLPSGKEKFRDGMAAFCFPLQWFGMKRYISDPMIISVDLNNGSIKESREKVNGEFELISFQPDETDNALMLAYRIKTGKHNTEIAIKRFLADGRLETISTLKGDRGKYLINGRLFRLGESAIVFSGTYGIISSKRKKEGDNKAYGMFFIKIGEGHDTTIRFHDFNDFPNFSSSIKVRYDKTGVFEKSDSKIHDIVYQVFLHKEIIESDGELIITGEAFYPEYEYETRVSYMSSGTGMYYYGYPGYYQPESRWVFKGFRYTHAIVASFDSIGNISWENSIETSNILSDKLEEKVNILQFEDENVLVYAHNGKIYAKIISHNEPTVDGEEFEPELLFEDDKVKENYYTKMSKWYDNYFILSGKQRIINRKKGSRTVFYISKVAFQ